MISDRYGAIAALIEQDDKFDLLSTNDEGANCYAFKALHKPLNREVFLKVYDVDEEGDVFSEPRILVEAMSQEGGSSHLIEVLDAERLGDDYILFVMECVDGNSLNTILESGPLSLCCAIDVAKGILHGVAFLHRHLFVHRDLKPGNILLDSFDGKMIPRICDFGSVKKIANATAKVNASRNSAIYLPPEGWGKPSQYEVVSDIYQVGMILSELINGQLPYADEDHLDRAAFAEMKKLDAKELDDLEAWDRCTIVDGAIERRVKRGKILDLLVSRPYLDRKLKKIINKATNLNPNSRYQSAVAMLADLSELSCPDWQRDGDKYIARRWRSWDWLICQIERRGKVECVVKRVKSGNEGFRKWKEFPDYQQAFSSVAKFK